MLSTPESTMLILMLLSFLAIQHLTVACISYNSNRKATDPNCTIAVWYRRILMCGIKASADRPIPGHLVQGTQPIPGPPPPKPFRFSNAYTDHMVLQSSPQRSKIWGFCPNNTASVTVVFGEEKLAATVQQQPDGERTWTALLPATDASFTPHTVSARMNDDVDETIHISDVLFGDVWVCSGQSNMAYGLNGSNGIALVHPPVNDSVIEGEGMRNYPFIRLFRAGHQLSPIKMLEFAPAEDGGSMPAVQGWSTPCIASGHCRVDFSNICWFFGRDTFVALSAINRTRPIGLIGTYFGGTADELWSSPDALRKCLATRSLADSGKNSELWNGQIYPIINTTIKGAVWYQGEADSSHPGGAVDGYNCTFPAMIADWREKWLHGTDGQTESEFPFGFVQLNSVGNGTTYDNPSAAPGNDPFSPQFGFAGLRWSQTAGYGYVPNDRMPNVFMATSVDTPDRPHPFRGVNGVFDPGFNVHSPFKQPTASRLARAGLVVAYGVNSSIVDTVGPLPKHVSPVDVDGNVVITLQAIGNAGGIEVHSTQGFEVLVDGRWHSVSISTHTYDTVTVGGVGASATHLRYNWYSNPCGTGCYECAVYVKVKGLPGPVLSGAEPTIPLPPFFVRL
eukprot:m.25095 g.25095  ORF g.25095 m.25095 type:complete len:621 (+) comp13137_c0_seq1:240-2102(+)